VVLILVESLSARFLGAFGNPDGLTPNLDRLAHEGMLFTDLRATGTRTVRGLEAVSLSVPPTPGYSIVKRQQRSLFSLGTVPQTLPRLLLRRLHTSTTWDRSSPATAST
jgi:phosphoglycerol transferase MdoB-like AlkP superfamily enzyme